MIVETKEIVSGSRLAILEGDISVPSSQGSRYSGSNYFIPGSRANQYINPFHTSRNPNETNTSRYSSYDGSEYYKVSDKEKKGKKIREHLRGVFVDQTELLGGDEFDGMNGEELLGFTKAVTREDVAVLPLILEGDLIQTVEDVKKYREFLRGLLVDHGEFLGGDEFDNMTDEELLGFFKKLWKGIKKGVSSVGKFIGKGVKGAGKLIGKVAKGVGKVAGNVAKGIYKGAGNVIKFVGKNAGGLLKAGLSFLPGGSIIAAGIDSLSQIQQDNQQNESSQNQQLENYPSQVQEYYQPEISSVMPQYQNMEEYYYPEENTEYYEDVTYPEYVEGLGALKLKDLIKKAGDVTKWITQPQNQRRVAEYFNAQAESQTQKDQLFKQANFTAGQKQKESELRYTTGIGIQNFISSYGLYLVVGLALILLFTQMNKTKN